MEKPFDGLCNQSTNLNQLERKQLQLYSSHYWLAYKDGLLWTGQDHH